MDQLVANSFNNWRGIALQPVGGKNLCIALLNSVQSKIDAIQRDKQHGFS